MKTITILNSMKSGYFMLVACVTLLLGVSACSSEEFGIEVPEVEKELTIDELIELAEKLIIRTRVNNTAAVVMATSETDFSFECQATKDMTIRWGDGSTSLIQAGSYMCYSHTYTDGKPVHSISIETSEDVEEVIKKLYVTKILALNVTYNTILQTLIVHYTNLKKIDLTGCSNLEYLYLSNNKLDFMDFTKCPNLKLLDISWNNFTSVDVSCLSYLEVLRVDNNQLTSIYLSENKELKDLSAGYNLISNIDLCNNQNLEYLYIENNQITDLNLINNRKIKLLNLSELPIATINNHPISEISFASLPNLKTLYISTTPFTALDLSTIPQLRDLIIHGTNITKLDISKVKLNRLETAFSNLTEIEYNSDCLTDIDRLSICYTPFMKDDLEVFMLLSSLPDRSKTTMGCLSIDEPGLITSSLLETLKDYNWQVSF